MYMYSVFLYICHCTHVPFMSIEAMGLSEVFSPAGLCQFRPNKFAAEVKPMNLGETCIYMYVNVVYNVRCTFTRV